MDAGTSLITKIVDEGRLNEATRSIESDFLDPEIASVYNYLQRHFSNHKKVPSRDTVQTAFPNFEFADATEPLSFYIEEVKEAQRRVILEEDLPPVASIYQKDTQKAEELLRDILAKLHITHKSFQDVNFAESALDLIEDYHKKRENPGVDGIPSNWSRLDYETLGWHGEEFIVLVGEKYMGKSWLMIWLAYQAMLHGECVLFVTKEMSQKQVIRRLASIVAKVQFDSLRRGELTKIEEQRFEEAMAELAKSSHRLIVARQGVSTVADIESKAVEVDATIILGDSIYLFDPERGYKFHGEVNKRMDISQKCKEIAQRLAVPFIVSVQAGRRKTKERIPTLDDIEWSNAFSQDADTVVFINKEEIDKEIGRAHMYLLKSRDSQETDFYINQNFHYMDFSQRDDQSQPSTEVFDDEDLEWDDRES